MELLEKIKEYAAQYEKEVREISDQLREEKMPALSRTLFDEYEINGNRLRYEAVYFKRREFLSAFGLASIIWHKKEDIQKLEYVIGEICSEGCWALSAHVKRLEDPNWRMTIDLTASETGHTLAHLYTLLKDELSEETKECIRKEVFRRILTPFMSAKAPAYGWEDATNNWNAVCCGNIGSTAIFLLEDGAEKEKLLSRIRYAIETYYLEGFGADGACTEGLGYWGYGFMNMVVFAMDQRALDPTYDLMALEKTEKIAHFQEKCYFAHGRTISFSDGSGKGKYPMGLTCCLADLYRDICFPDPVYARGFTGDRCWNWNELYTGWRWTKQYLEDVENGIVEAPKPLAGAGVEFLPDAEWCILRGEHNTAVVAKGGNNDEPHNHNDVGSFFYLVDGEALLDDLGSGEYTKKYFSNERYEIFCTRGLSHNIPVIGGSDQKAGSEYRADAFEVRDGNTILISFAKAYGVENLQKLSRKLTFEERSGMLTVEDHAECKAKISVFENLVTRYPVTVEQDEKNQTDAKEYLVIHGERHKLIITVSKKIGTFHIQKEAHTSYGAKDQLINRISWELLVDGEMNADCAMKMTLA